jgi:protein TonB
MAERKGLAITALALGIFGLFTAGGLGVGSLLGLLLAAAALRGRSRAGRDVAWAAVAANLVALLTILPVGAAIWAYWQSPQAFASDDDTLPEPVSRGRFEEAFLLPPPPPPPPPLPPPRLTTATPPATPATLAPGARARSAARARPEAPLDPAAPLRVGGAIAEPRKTRNVSPVYPAEAIAARVQGVVILECTISPEGKVVAVKTLRGVPLLDEAAIEAVRQWEYTPTLLNGVPVPVIMTVTVKFKLS